MYKFVFYFILSMFFFGGGVNYWPKTQQFCKQSPIQSTIIKNSLTEHIFFRNTCKTINFAVSDISSAFRGHKLFTALHLGANGSCVELILSHNKSFSYCPTKMTSSHNHKIKLGVFWYFCWLSGKSVSNRYSRRIPSRITLSKS